MDIYKTNFIDFSIYWSQYRKKYDNIFLDDKYNYQHIPEINGSIEYISNIIPNSKKYKHNYFYKSNDIGIPIECNTKLSINEIINLVIIEVFKKIFNDFNVGINYRHKEYREKYINEFIKNYIIQINPEYIYIDKIEDENVYYINYKLSDEYLKTHTYEDYAMIEAKLHFFNNDSDAILVLTGNGEPKHRKNFYLADCQ